jgi:ADP-ribosylglycohydrolase
VVADSVHYFISGGRLDTEDQVRAYVKREFEVANRFDPRFAESWDDVAPDLDYTKPAEDLPYSLVNVESNVNELVPTAVGIFLIFRHSLEEAVCAAARSGGDTDTVAILVGALSGAYHGAANVPERWLKGVAMKEKLEALAQGLANLW